MRIVYDNIVFAIQKYGGVSVVWQELLSRLQIIANNDVKYIDVRQSKAANYSRSKLKIDVNDVLSYINYPKVTRYMSVRLSEPQPFIFHSSYYRYCTNPKAINVTTVHDFTYEFFVKGIKQKVHTWQKFSAIRHSAAVVCISENTKRDLLRLLPDVDERKVHVIYNGVSEKFRQLHEPAESAELPFPAGTYLVFIGRRDSYKNFELAVRGAAATSMNLLIIGSRLSEAERRDVEQYLPPRQYQCLTHISDERLNQLYNYAAALVYPSSYEGFGLPVLEAQRAGCPVIALSASSIPEVIGKTPLLMQRPCEENMVHSIQNLSNIAVRNQLVEEGLANVQRFSWDLMATQYLQLYEELLANNKI